MAAISRLGHKGPPVRSLTAHRDKGPHSRVIISQGDFLFGPCSSLLNPVYFLT